MKMRCPSCHAKCTSNAASCSSCGTPLPRNCAAGLRPVSRLAYRICRSGKELVAVFCLCLLIFTGATLTLSCAAAVYEPLTAAAGLDAFSLHTTDGSEPLTDQEALLLKEKSAQARTLAGKYAVGSVFGLLLFSGSLLVLVRVFFVSNRLRHTRSLELESVDFDPAAVGTAPFSPADVVSAAGNDSNAAGEAEPAAPDSNRENNADRVALPTNPAKG